MSHTPRAIVPMQLIQECLVATFQAEIDEALLAQFQTQLLARLDQETIRCVILDLSSIAIMDLVEFGKLRRIEAMIKLMGTSMIVVGLQPGVIAALITLDADVDQLRAALNVDEALGLLRQERKSTAGREQDHTRPPPPRMPKKA